MHFGTHIWTASFMIKVDSWPVWSLYIDVHPGCFAPGFCLRRPELRFKPRSSELWGRHVNYYSAVRTYKSHKNKLIIQISDTQQAWVIREFWKAAFWNLPPKKVVFFWECQSQSGDETGRIGGLIKQRDRKKWVVPIKLWVNRGAIPPSRAAICCWGHKHLQGGKCWGDNTALSFYFVISSPECTMDAVKRLLSMLSFQLKPPKRQTGQAVHYEVDSRKLVVQHL